MVRAELLLKRLPNKLFLQLWFHFEPSLCLFSIFDNKFALAEYVLKPNLEDDGEEVGGEEEDEDCLVPAQKVFIISIISFRRLT